MSRLSRRTLAILAGLLGVSALLAPGQVANAAQPAEVAVNDCVDVISQATSIAGTTAEDVYGCVEPDPNAPPATGAAVSDVSINAVPCGQRSWVVTRTTACANGTGVLVVREVQSRMITGVLYFSVRNETVLNPKAATFTQSVSFTFDLARSWGYAGTMIHGEASCSGACTTTSGSFGPGSVTAPGARTGTASFRTTVSASGQVEFMRSTWKYWFTNLSWLTQRSNSASNPVATLIRCDNKLGGITSVGCVFPEVRPTLGVSPVNPTYHRHIQLALQYRVRAVLTRMQDPVLQGKNRDAACPPSKPRPPGYTCDEYPFASTFEGAFTGNHPFGRTFSGCQVDWLKVRTYNDGGLGYSACMIGETDNTNGGVELGQFYNDQRVLDNDRFNVTVR